MEQFIERYAVDVSQGGIFIRTKEPLAVGTQMKFEFQLRDSSPLIAGEGTVVWTRENDPSRPAIAPGMGVRFDRLADGSQGILERILSEKAKQAPLRPAAETTKPPLFTDTPTRVAPAPLQDALLGKRRDPLHNDSHTPLPKPMPFHSDADEFPDEAFEEATKVRALDELIAQTADGTPGQDELAARRSNGRADAAFSDSVSDRAETRPLGDGHEPPHLPSPPELSARPQPKLLDTSPSPRSESPPPLADAAAKTRLGLGVETSRGRLTPPPLGQSFGPSGGPSFGPPIGGPSFGQPSLEAPPLPPGVRAVPAEQTEPARMPPVRSRSSAPLLILVLLLVAAAGAAGWFLVLRPRQAADQHAPGGSDPATATPGSAVADGSATAGSASGSGTAAPAELVDTVIGAAADGAIVEITGTQQSGPAPFTAKLERGKLYKARVTARGFAALEIDVKGGDDKRAATLVAKPRVISIDSDPQGAAILVDSGASGHSTPFDVELTAAQAAKKTLRVQLRKSGYRTLERVIDSARFTEEDTRMIAKLNERLTVQPQVNTTRPPAVGSGSAEGSDASSGVQPDGSAVPDGTPQGSGSAATPPPPATGSAGPVTEPEPDFTKHP